MIFKQQMETNHTVFLMDQLDSVFEDLSNDVSHHKLYYSMSKAKIE